MNQTDENLSPVQKQYRSLKQRHPDFFLLFKMGDFYEAFFEDAETLARVTGVMLTTRARDENRIPMAGVPFHAVESYLKKLIAAGIRVAIAEPVDGAPAAKAEVVRTEGPGVVVTDDDGEV